MFITNFYKEFEHVNSISSTMHVSNTQEGQERNRKKLFHNSQTLLSLDSFSKCNIIKVSTKTEIIKCDMSEEWLNGYFLDFKKQNTLV